MTNILFVSDQVEIADSGSLEFHSVQIEDEGVYFCVAYNEYSVPTSRASNTARITVQGWSSSWLHCGIIGLLNRRPMSKDMPQYYRVI